MAAASVSDLLQELQLEPLYGLTFAEYELTSVAQLTSLGADGLEELLRELGVTYDHRDKVRNLALSARPCGASGGAWSPAFLAACRPLHAAHMGCENMGPLLYSLVRFAKPRRVLEVGAGYTSLWLLQALRDNDVELARCSTAVAQEGYTVEGGEWVLPDVLAARAKGGPSLLHCVDNMAHEHTTAHLVIAIAARLGLSDHLQLHEADAYELAEQFISGSPTASGARSNGANGGRDDGGDGNSDDDGGGVLLDMLWLDFGVGVGGKLAPFLEAWWPRIRPGGYLLVHSTLGNAVTRKWVDGMRERRSPAVASDASAGSAQATPRARDAMGTEFETLSFMEPHKKFQSSVSLFQRRPDGWGEPIHTMYP